METLEFSRDGDVAWLRLNRPDKLNSFTVQMWHEMRTLGREVQDDDSIRALVVIGNGRAFSSGIDTSVFTGGSRDDTLSEVDGPNTHDDPTAASILRVQESYSWLETARYPTIAAVRGYAFGAGLQLALACDIRVFARGTKVGLLEHKYGILPDLGGTQRLPRVVGAGKAKEMIWTAARIDAEEAYRIGLCERLVDDADLEKEVEGARERDRRAAAARGAGCEACGRGRRCAPDRRRARRRSRGAGGLPALRRHARSDHRVRRDSVPRTTRDHDDVPRPAERTAPRPRRDLGRVEERRHQADGGRAARAGRHDAAQHAGGARPRSDGRAAARARRRGRAAARERGARRHDRRAAPRGAVRARVADARVVQRARSAPRPVRRGARRAARRRRIGSRKVDMHLRGLEAMGAHVEVEHGFVHARATRLARRASRPRVPERRRDREPHVRGRARQGQHRHRERGARAGGHRPRRVPRPHGCAGRRRGDVDDRDRRRRRARRRPTARSWPTASKPEPCSWRAASPAARSSSSERGSSTSRSSR